jgi:hypothetical protein
MAIAAPLGLPPLPIPADNPPSEETSIIVSVAAAESPSTFVVDDRSA